MDHTVPPDSITRTQVLVAGLLAVPVCVLICGVGFFAAGIVGSDEPLVLPTLDELVVGVFLIGYCVSVFGGIIGIAAGAIPLAVSVLVWPWLQSPLGRVRASFVLGVLVALLVLSEFVCVLSLADELISRAVWGWSVGAASIAAATAVLSLHLVGRRVTRRDRTAAIDRPEVRVPPSS